MVILNRKEEKNQGMEREDEANSSDLFQSRMHPLLVSGVVPKALQKLFLNF